MNTGESAGADRSVIKRHGDTEFVNGSDNILSYLAEAYGVARDHHRFKG